MNHFIYIPGNNLFQWWLFFNNGRKKAIFNNTLQSRLLELYYGQLSLLLTVKVFMVDDLWFQFWNCRDAKGSCKI